MFRLLLIASALLVSPLARADDAPAPMDWSASFQSTYVWQTKPAFSSPYRGAHSMDPAHEKSYSFSATGFFVWHIAPATEFHVDAEAVQGLPLSHLQGLSGLTNGEAQKSAGPRLLVYRARAFLRRTWEPGEGDRAVVTVGNFAVNDVFDRSDYSGDARTQFLNASFLTHAAFDFAADARGYTWGSALEWSHGDWQVRAGHFLLPRQPNGPSLDWQAFRHFSQVIEAVHTHRLGEREGNVRVLAWRDRAVLASYEDALAIGGAPSLDAVRRGEKTKRGVGFAFDQAVTKDAGVFARAMRGDGRTEVYAFSEVDRSLSAGALVHGSAWSRGEDSAGLAFARNALSSSHRAYLAAGGLGYFLGDGRINYRPEQIVEAFYSAAFGKHLSISADWQQIRHPASNADRGPVRVASLRLHTEW